MEKAELIYVYDPLCGWCYGFSPVMMKIKEKFGESINIGVISGGMVIGEREGPIGNIAPFIKSAYKHVEQASGVKFGDNFIKGILEEGKIIFSSMPPSLALTVFKSFDLSHSLDFAHSIQRMIYYEGKNPNLISSYLELIKPYGIDEKDFSDRFNDSTFFATETFKDFKLSSQLGVTGFPTLFIRNKDKIHILTRGYDTFEKIENKIRNLFE